MSYTKHVRRDLLEISPYRLDTDFPSEAIPNLVRMSLNENPLIEKPKLTQMLKTVVAKVDPRDYPEPHARLAVDAISKFHKIDPLKVLVGNGLDDVLDRLVRTFVDKDSGVLVAEPTFFMYTYYTQLCQGQKIEVMLNTDFSLDIETLIRTSKDAKLIFICSPNSPTGNQFEKKDIIKVIEKCNSIVVVDETYVDFSKYSMLELTNKYDNLIVLRTFSKAYGLAGIRIGYLIGESGLVDTIKKTVHPFNVGTLAQHLVVEALKNHAYFQKRFKAVIKERNWLIQELKSIDGVTVFPSDANFILFKIIKGKSSSQIQNELRRKGLLIKDRGKIPMLQNCLRVTVGTRASNKRFLRELRRILS